MGGSMQKQMASAIPTHESPLLLFAAEVAMASCLESLNHPVTLDNMYQANAVD